MVDGETFGAQSWGNTVSSNAPSFWSQYVWDITHGFLAPPIPVDVRNYYNKYHNTNSSAPTGQKAQASAPSLHPTPIILVFGGAIAIALGGTQIGPLVNLSLVAVVVYELTIYKPQNTTVRMA